MFQEECIATGELAAKKVLLLRHQPIAYFLLSMLAGIYIGIGILLIFTIGGLLTGFSGAKIIMGVSFGIALSLVVMAGAELFTGNNFVMCMGVMLKNVTLRNACYLWIICWLGNLAGAVLLALIYHYSGLAKGSVGEFIVTASQAKMAAPALALLMRGILCNLLVCLAVWCGIKMKSETGKLIMIFWCLFAFITSGFEHSIANMTLLAVGLLEHSNAMVTMSGYAYNLFFVTLGNMIGGIVFVAIPYALIAKQKAAKEKR